MKAKTYLGLQKSLTVIIDEESKTYHKSTINAVKKALKKYEVELLEQDNSFGIIRLEYDADYVIEEWEEIMEGLEVDLPNAKMVMYEGVHDEMTDDFRYDYENLQIEL